MNQQNLLSREPRQAVEEMIKLTEQMAMHIEAETTAVATNDGTTFTTNEMNKEAVIEMYEKAAAEFHTRLEEFRQVDKNLINKLQTTQDSLAQSTKNNLKLLDKLQKEEGA